MRFGPGVAVLALVLSFAAPAAAEDCPAKSRDDVLAAMKAASCNRAMQIASACSGGATGDVGLTDAVETKCEGDFLARLKAQQKRAYQREKDACDRKYSGEEGTMYISFAAFCRAKVAQRYSQRALKAASPARAR
ncbi:hypothetical protein [Bradyrhizobium sp. AUGA SZCCT0182]|uniref:hypothetical protein n=1 Tax=Bradyrhizobium sp. AUGA SZCCT0182 TaxID=2807667 RepID=UPI001BA61475|nr:hypothetical protein [Bradyrhizobium sp. AUGA SZCCT0182]MBR1234505.1 hypothetical protein [Bradyrhizobium sp. AUGA SZCCT0182]